MRLRLPRPATVIAVIALFAALSGGAWASGVVPLARHAYTADRATNSKKLGGKTLAQLRASLRGARGPAGPAGTTGPAGATGPAGPAGPKGDTGSTGAQGPQGPTGPQGPVGAGLKIVGSVATSGDLPASGTTGDAYLVGGDLWVWTGSAWTDAGPVQGPKGDTGSTGPAGATGATGPQGPKGDTGATGAVGATGPAGSTGPAGPTGPQGPAGTAAVTVHTQAFSLNASGTSGDQGAVTANCGTGQLAVGGGFDSTGSVVNFDTRATAGDDGWTIYLENLDNATNTGTVYAYCLG